MTTQSNFETFGKAEEVYSFDQPILAEEREYTLLEAGSYPFVITNVEKKFYEPKEGSKLPSCPQAQITLEVDGGDQFTICFTQSQPFGKLQNYLWP